MARQGGRAVRLVAALLLPCTLAVPMGLVAEARTNEGHGFAIPKRGSNPHPRLAQSLRDDLEARRAVPSALPPGEATRGAPAVPVVLEVADLNAGLSAVVANRGTVISEVPGLIKATVPAATLGRLSDAEGVALVREPYAARIDTTSEGVAKTNASSWHSSGQQGAGTKVAVVDIGFQDYTAKLGTELPASVDTDLSRCTSPFAEVHGTAVAEIVHDMAPSASLLLVCVADEVDFASALASLAGQGVDVVNLSIGFTLTGRGDGSGDAGTPGGAVAALRRQGILVVGAAGNYGGRHFHARAVGDPVEGEFNDLVDLSGDDTFSFTVAGYGIAGVAMKWDGWPTTHQDFDLYVANAGTDGCGNPSPHIVTGSELDQTTQTLRPVEDEVVFQNCSPDPQTFYVLINRFSGSATPRLDLFFDGDVIGLERATGSDVAEPATSAAVLAVGAHCWANDSMEYYSSTGPTIDGRTKPDLTGPDATSSSVYGDSSWCSAGFTGTSAAAPHVAGAAAVLLGANPDLDLAELEQLLRRKAGDSGPPGPDNTTGSGRLRLGPAGDLALQTPEPMSSVVPIRLVDTRPGTPGPVEEARYGSAGRTEPIHAYARNGFSVAGIAGVPSDATAVVLNVTVTQPTAAGYLTIYPGTVTPIGSSLNFVAGQTVAQHVTAAVGQFGQVNIYNGSSGTTHVILDLAGWYGPTGVDGPATDRFTPRPVPARALDSRPGPLGYAEGAFGASGRTTPIPTGGYLDVQVAGLGGVPSNAAAVVLNVTVTKPTSGGHLLVHPTGSPKPQASSLNFVTGQTIANLVVVPVGTGGKVRVSICCGSLHVVIDTVGWFLPDVGAGYVALAPPVRDLDTRNGNGPRMGPLGGGSTFWLSVARFNQVPVDAAAVMLSVIAVKPSANGYLSVYPGTFSRPSTSNINFVPGSVVPNAVVSALGADGTVAFYNSGGSTSVVSDLAGYFIDPAYLGAPTPP